MNSVTVYVASLWAIAQEKAAEGVPAAAQKAPPWSANLVLLILPVVLLFLLVLSPERKKRAEATKRLAGLKKNDRVVTIGGIHGVVVQASADSQEVVIRVDESNGTKLRMNRTAISQIISGDDSGEKT